MACSDFFSRQKLPFSAHVSRVLQLITKKRLNQIGQSSFIDHSVLTREKKEEEKGGFRRKLVQRLRVIGGTATCSKCGKEAEILCLCGASLCSLDTISHKCVIQLRSTYSEDVLEALR